jgi:AraC family transcriptional regulator
METPFGFVRRIEAEARYPMGRAQIMERSFSAPVDILHTVGENRLEVSLLPHPNRGEGCYPDLWGKRFEPWGDVFWMPAGHLVHARSEIRQQRSIVLAFEEDSLAAEVGDEVQWTEVRARSCMDLGNTGLRAMVARLGAELTNPGLGSDVLIEAKAAEIAVTLVRHCAGVKAGLSSGGLAPWRLRLIDERLAADWRAPSLAELAKLCNLSIRQVARGFRVSRGCSIGAYVEKLRIERAQKLLASDTSIKAIAAALGFSNSSNFAVAFRRATGETPREYRDRERPRIVAGGRRA